MDRRRFLLTSLLGACVPRAAAAQSRANQVRIGLLSPSSPMPAAAAFVAELRKLGYAEKQNLTIDYRWTVSWDRLPEQAVALSRLPLDAIVIVSTPAAIAAKNATKKIPIVMAASADPVGAGVVESLARPGGNVTGLALMNPDLTAKRVEILKQLVPDLSWLGAVHRGFAEFPVVANWLKENEEAGRRVGARVQSVPISAAPVDWEKGLLAIPKRPGVGVTVLEDPEVVAHSQRIAELLLKHHVPAVFPFREHVETGGLLGYGVSLAQLFRRAAHYVAKILAGANPSDLPIEQPTTFDLAINKNEGARPHDPAVAAAARRSGDRIAHVRRSRLPTHSSHSRPRLPPVPAADICPSRAP